MAFKIGEGGLLLDENGQAVKFGEKEINISDAVNSIVQTRLTKEKANAEAARTELIAQYEAKLTNTVDPKIRADLETKISELEGQLSNVEGLANRRAQETQKQMEGKVLAAAEAAKTWEKNWRSEKLLNDINRVANELGFAKPKYLEMEISPNVQWTEEVDASGKGNGKWGYHFVLPVTDEKGNTTPTQMTLPEAAAHIAKMDPNYIKGSAAFGNRSPNFQPGGDPNTKPKGLESIYKK